MSQLDPRIEAIRAKYDLDASDFWELPQKRGTWIAKHSALEVVAVKANIVWSMPQIIEAASIDGIAAMVVMGTMGTRSEWATGEAGPKNNKNAYPWAMAEKRAKDRVVLKLSGIAGLVYSEDEADDFKQPADAPPKPSARPVDPTKVFNEHLTNINTAKTPDDLKAVFAVIWKSDLRQTDKLELREAYEAKKADLASGYVAPNFDGMQQ
jgi:hypothetical protein